MIFKEHNAKKNINAGFTLVELIVVLIVLGILASAAVYGIIAYIDMTRYNNNQRTAETIYQSAQGTLNHMSENGTIDAWCRSVIGPKGLTGSGENGVGTEDPSHEHNPELFDTAFNVGSFRSFTEGTDTYLPGQSVHMRYAVTYTPGVDNDQNKLIKELIYQDFKSTDIFSGIITIEFDVEKALDAKGSLRLSASVCSVFYDSKRTAWDSVAFKNYTDMLVPIRDEEYRRNTSLIGYYCGTVSLSSIDRVFVPSEVDIDHFTLRNGETLEMKWNVTSEDVPITGVPDHIHYTFALYDADKDEKFCDLILNENSLFEGIPYETLYNAGNTDNSLYKLLKFDKSHFSNGNTNNISFASHAGTMPLTVVYTQETVSDIRGVPITVYKASVSAIAKVYVHRVSDGNYSFDYNKEAGPILTEVNNYYNFPLTISYEIYDVYGTTISEGLYYSLSLDSMMSRNAIDAATSPANNQRDIVRRTLNFSINRLINTGSSVLKYDGFPTNIYATMYAEQDQFEHLSASYNGNTLPKTDTIYATRALDDPVYYMSPGNYRYMQKAASKDSGTDYAVVNSYFGDLGQGSFGTKPSGSGNEKAVITSYRHLYNIHLMEKNTSADFCYSIVRDLDWYKIDTSLGRETYYSEVVVYSVETGRGLVGHSPVPVPPVDPNQNPRLIYGDVLNVVSFPSLPLINSHTTLKAEENTLTNEVSVINNLQMRMPSFYDKNYNANELNGYGMINVNQGYVINIRANGLNLVLNNLPDGSPDDRKDIENAFLGLITGEIGTTYTLSFKGSSPVGGLVGTNVGYIGAPNEEDPDKNTTKFSNCIVTSLCDDGTGWKFYRLSSCGGIVGDNGSTITNPGDGYLCGNMEATGKFLGGSWINVSSIIGYTRSDVSALLKVDNSVDRDGAIIDLVDNSGKEYSSILYATSDAIGGAVGSIDKHAHFCQDETKLTRLSHSTENGVLTVTEASSPVYAIDVKLEENTYILLKTDDAPKQSRPMGIGGAVGRVNEYQGNILSVKVINKGVIYSTQGYNTNPDYLGGAIGIITPGTVSKYIDIWVENSGNIGTAATDNSLDAYLGTTAATGGAVGKIDRLGSASAEIIISAKNSSTGRIYGSPTLTGSDAGVGGAVGVIAGCNTNSSNIPNYYVYSEVNSIVSGNMVSGISATAANKFGVGGTVGYIEYLPKNSSFYCLLGKNAIIYSAGNNAGGCIGSEVNIDPTDPSGKYTSVTAEFSEGSYVRAAENNAGGCIGNAAAIERNTNIRTILNGNLSVYAIANAGGVCGRIQSKDNTANSTVGIESKTASAKLNVKVSDAPDKAPAVNNDNAGGLIGLVTNGNAGFNFSLSIPSSLVIAINSYDNAGGMIGHMLNGGHTTSNDMTVTLKSESKIYAVRNNAGGCIGNLETSGTFYSGITVNTESSLNGAAALIMAGGQNAGGCIGRSIGKLTITSSITTNAQTGFIKGSGNVGGCIGTLEGVATISETADISLTGNILAIQNVDGADTASAMGGCIGNSSETKIYGNINCSLGSLGISGYSNIGGLIGKLYKGQIGENASVSYTGNISLITGCENIGGCIGKIESVSNVSGSIYFSGENASILCTSSSTSTPSEYAGGIAGSITGSSFKNSSVLSFAGSSASIKGANYTGGIAGAISGVVLESNASVTFAGEYIRISGGEYTGGIFGYANAKTSIKGNVVLSYQSGALTPADPNESVKYSSITGTVNTGGIIGCLDSESSISGNVQLNYQGSGSSINGTVNTGGIIGCFDSKSSISGNAKLNYQGAESSITGADNTGGIFGKVYNSSSGGSVQYNFTGTNVSIIGSQCVGGIIGLTDTSNNSAVISFAPVSQCSIIGTNYVGGCAGRALSRKDNGNLHNKPKIVLTNCTLTITGSGYTGGALGSAENNCFYSGATIELNNSAVTIESTESSAGGNLGYLEGGNVGGSTNLYITCKGTSSFTVKAKAYAGGLIGVIAKEYTRRTSTPNISITSNSTSSINISGGTAAGGLVGYNGNEFGRTANISSVYVPNGGNINISATSGVWGALIGVNEGKFTSNTNITYYVTLRNYPAGADAQDLLFGSTDNGTVISFKYSVGGNTGTYTQVTTP